VTTFKRVGAAVVGLAALAACGSQAADPHSAVPTTTALVVRTDMASSQQLSGTLGYAESYTVVNQAGPGVFTALPQPGAVISRGQVVYQVDGRPIALFYGDAPAWRPLFAGVADAPDNYELQANLVALGFAPSVLRVDNAFDWATAIAVRSWQRSLGLPQTGVVNPGDVVYMPGPLRITAVEPRTGMLAQPGQPVLEATSTQHAVLVQLSVSLESKVKASDTVTISLPDGTATAGTVTTIGTVASATVAGAQNGPAPEATVPMTIAMGDPSAAGTLDLAPVSVGVVDAVHRSVLAVPVVALIAQPDGKFAVEVVVGGQRQLVTVTTGLFDDRGLVEVTSPDLREGMLVEVPVT
jgi:peptidoglycan hydrolase-like protein with peptidoglycan-binding domain